MSGDVDIRNPETRFAAVARAVILDDGHVLVARTGSSSHTFLPGGHIRVGESVHQCLARELREELGLSTDVGGYLGAVESWWADDTGYFGLAGRTTHQIDHYFLATAEGLHAPGPPASTESHLTFLWAAVGDLAAHTLLPAPLQLLIPQYASGNRGAWWAVAGNP